MSKVNKDQVNKSKSVEGKIDYYTKRVNDPNFSDGQRRWAAKRISDLCGEKKPATAPKQIERSSRTRYTDAQKHAWSAGLGFGAAKAGKTVPVKDENKDSFRNGLQRGKNLK